VQLAIQTKISHCDRSRRKLSAGIKARKHFRSKWNEWKHMQAFFKLNRPTENRILFVSLFILRGPWIMRFWLERQTKSFLGNNAAKIKESGLQKFWSEHSNSKVFFGVPFCQLSFVLYKILASNPRMATFSDLCLCCAQLLRPTQEQVQVANQNVLILVLVLSLAPSPFSQCITDCASVASGNQA